MEDPEVQEGQLEDLVRENHVEVHVEHNQVEDLQMQASQNEDPEVQ